MVPVRLISHQSTLRLTCLLGCTTKPAEYILAFSGWRSRLPPKSVVAELAGICWPVFGSMAPVVAKGLTVTGSNICLNVGTRKPVLYEERTRNCSIGAQRSENFGFLDEPKPVYWSMRPAAGKSRVFKMGSCSSAN